MSGGFDSNAAGRDEVASFYSAKEEQQEDSGGLTKNKSLEVYNQAQQFKKSKSYAEYGGIARAHSDAAEVEEEPGMVIKPKL